jgi:hypothetical protein
MSKITGPIPPQSFELVRDRIGEILADEINNQFAIVTNNPDLKATVWVERFFPFDETELPAVVVMLAKGSYDGQTQIQADGTYTFNIDGHFRSKSKADGKGDKKAMLNLQRLLGVMRGILDHPEYTTLGFQNPFVMKRHIKDISIADPNGNDVSAVVMGRLTFEVKVPEKYNLKVPGLISGYDTTVKLEETEKGYYYSSN